MVKRFYKPTTTLKHTTWYARDAQGNILSIYERATPTSEVKQTEVHIYGSSRIGIEQRNITYSTSPFAWLESEQHRHAGTKRYELTDHLGNVRVTISDLLVPRPASSFGYATQDAEVIDRRDYYPFGAIMPGRNYNAGSYRHGFNGKENDNEIAGVGNSQDYGLRMYDPRIARFKSVDPLAKDFPWNSPYSFAEGNPIENIDLDGAEKYDYRLTMTKQGEVKMTLTSQQDIVDKVIVGYRTVSYGADIQVPIYETRINQRQEYNINGRNASLSAVQELQGTKKPAPIIKAGMDKISRDYAANGGQFSENYNVAFGRFLFEQGFKGVKQSDFVKSATETWNTVDNATWKNGSTLYHMYESFVRQNDNTGYDKLLHFTASAYYTMKYGPKTSGFLGWSKEAFKDWLPGVFGIGEGWDNNDMRANQDGINYGKTVNNAVQNNTGEFDFCDD